MNTEKINPRLTAIIVKSYVVQHRVRPEQFSDLITSVHQALGQLGRLTQPEEVRAPAVSVRRSVHRDYVICLDCGWRFDEKTAARFLGREPTNDKAAAIEAATPRVS